MRRRNASPDGRLVVQAIAGTHVVLLGFDLPQAACPGLLGFALRRQDHTEGEFYWLSGYKTFRSVEPHPAPGLQFSTRRHPIQGFTWSDFTAKPDHDYTYEVVALRGTPAAPLEAERAKVRVRTETAGERRSTHRVFFNRGAAASQEYARRFGDRSPAEVGPAAFDWLSRGAAEAIRDFIGSALDAHWGLRVLAYEFTDPQVLGALKEAWRARKVDVRVLYHAEDDSQRVANEAAIAKAAIKPLCRPRAAPGLALAHNKVIVLLRDGVARAVLSGSANFSVGGIYGHSNVVHICGDDAIAAKYQRLWDLLSANAPRSEAALAVQALTPLPQWAPGPDAPPQPAPVAPHGPAPAPSPPAPSPPDPVDAGETGRPDAVVRLAFATGTRAIFSPRPDLGALAQYAQRAHDARDALFMTFAFGMDVQFQEAYRTGRAPLRYALMEAMSGPTRTAAQKAANEAAIIALRRLPANKFAVGAFLKTGAFDRWLAERLSGLNRNVRYVHTKYLMTDPLGPDPLVITGSANFSRASTTDNDENMLVIRGDARVADIYLGEFMRMYNHFAFREWLARQGAAGTRGTTAAGTTAADPALYLDENDRWWQRYFGDGFAARQRRYFVGSSPLEVPAPTPVPSPGPPPA